MGDCSFEVLVVFAEKHRAYPWLLGIHPLIHPTTSMQAYDQHLNMILGDVEETITTVEIDDETYEEIIKVCSAAANLTSVCRRWLRS
jgi:hypothetical protein